MSKFDTVLTKLTVDLIKELLEGNKANFKASSSKKELVAAFNVAAFDAGDKILIDAINAEHKKAALEDLDSEYSETAKTKITKDFKKAFEKKGREALFKALKRETLDKFCTDMQFEEEASDKKDVEEALNEEVFIAGARKLFETMHSDFIKDVIKVLDIKKGSNKKVTIDRILGQAYEHLLEDEAEQTEASKKEKKKKPDVPKPDLVKGVTFEQIFQAYYLPELREWCKANGLMVSGARRDLIHRILAFLDGDTKTTKAGQKKKKRRAKSEATKKALAKKKRKEREEKDKAEGKEPAKKKRKTDKAAEESAEESSEEKPAASTSKKNSKK